MLSCECPCSAWRAIAWGPPYIRRGNRFSKVFSVHSITNPRPPLEGDILHHVKGPSVPIARRFQYSHVQRVTVPVLVSVRVVVPHEAISVEHGHDPVVPIGNVPAGLVCAELNTSEQVQKTPVAAGIYVCVGDRPNGEVTV